MSRWSTEDIERFATHNAFGSLMRGAMHDEVAQSVDRYLLNHVHLDPAKWEWVVRTPWRNEALSPWGPSDVSVTIIERSAVEQLGNIA